MKKAYILIIVAMGVLILGYIFMASSGIREMIQSLVTAPIKTNLIQLQSKCTTSTIIGQCPNGDYILYDIPSPTELLTSVPDVYDQNGNSLIYSASRNTLCCTESKSYLYILRKIQGKEVGCSPKKSKNLCK